MTKHFDNMVNDILAKVTEISDLAKHNLERGEYWRVHAFQIENKLNNLKRIAKGAVEHSNNPEVLKGYIVLMRELLTEWGELDDDTAE